MDSGKTRLELTSSQGANDIVNTNLERLCVSVGQLNNKNLCFFMDLVNGDLVFRATTVQLIQDISITIVTRE